jgi:hypothetical protein
VRHHWASRVASAVLLSLGLVTAVGQAGPPLPWQGCWGCSLGDLCRAWRQRQCCSCPDDYCGKALPCVPCAPRGCCDDYCGKALPCVPCAPRGCCDDYQPKCGPIWTAVGDGPCYRCCPGDGCGRGK